MQKTSTFLAFLVTMAFVAFVAILCRPGSGNSVSAKRRRPAAHIPRVTPKMTAVLLLLLKHGAITWVSVLDCQVVVVRSREKCDCIECFQTSLTLSSRMNELFACDIVLFYCIPSLDDLNVSRFSPRLSHASTRLSFWWFLFYRQHE
jgi:hypothetical protein